MRLPYHSRRLTAISLLRSFPMAQIDSLLFQFAQIALRIDGRGTACSGGGDCLFVDAVGHVARDENAGMFALGQIFRDQITLWIGVELSRKCFCIGIVAN